MQKRVSGNSLKPLLIGRHALKKHSKSIAFAQQKQSEKKVFFGFFWDWMFRKSV
jgi:hypothetical protein